MSGNFPMLTNEMGNSETTEVAIICISQGTVDLKKYSKKVPYMNWVRTHFLTS
jgi:hypothetical protein